MGGDDDEVSGEGSRVVWKKKREVENGQEEVEGNGRVEEEENRLGGWGWGCGAGGGGGKHGTSRQSSAQKLTRHPQDRAHPIFCLPRSHGWSLAKVGRGSQALPAA